MVWRNIGEAIKGRIEAHFRLSWFAGVLAALLSLLITLLIALAIGIFHRITALTLLVRIGSIANGITAAPLLVIVRLGVRICRMAASAREGGGR